jgi:hypothetical protein
MPTRIKVMVSLALVVLAVLAFLNQSAKGLVAPAWATLALGAFMILSIWVFPDVRRDDYQNKDLSTNKRVKDGA